MAEGNISLEFILKNIEKARNYLIKEMDQNELMSNKKKKGLYNSKLHWPLSYFSVCTFAVTLCISISAFASLVDIATGIMKSAIWLQICSITAGIKRYNSINNKKKKKHYELVSAKT